METVPGDVPRAHLPSRRFLLAGAVIVAAAAVFFAIQKTVLPHGSSAVRHDAQPRLSAGGSAEAFAEPEGGSISFADIFSAGTAETPFWKSSARIVTTAAPKKPSIFASVPTLERPVIDSVSTARFGNGDTVTIRGRNFTGWNRVFLSIDFKDKFVGIPSEDGTTLTFTASLTLTDNFRRSLSRLSAADRAKAIDHIIAVKSAETGESGVWHMPATISIENENGQSREVPVFVDILKGL